MTDDREPGGTDRAAAQAALAAAAARAGFANAADPVTGRSVLQAVGGVRGILEAVIPGFAFVLLFSISTLPVALGVSVGMAVLLVVARVVQRSPVSPALGGLLGTALSAGLALWTGRAEDNFVLGLWINVIIVAAFLISVLAGWPLIGVAVGFLYEEGTAWRRNKRKFRAMQWITLAWVALSAARLAVQVPLFLSHQVALLGTFKLLMGLPLYAPLLVVSWLVVRAAFPEGPGHRDAGAGPAGQS
ncbi:DUF3159 domain-containing protein [Naasia aerilata]|uniref:DUF3159 domain-containing protein n=1 Tax=Naasia aerilata TaxID=1162966 RepID=A0ABN6XPS8_9MICO|nr:DUF3159 domain-containing protein [Naasia aerilata]BDZ46884.1 hypothetical protein GCM10025866_27930 [Naasia aerilata]